MSDHADTIRLDALRELEKQAERDGPMPDYFIADIVRWLVSNEKRPDEVRHGRFPLGMVQRWIERAAKAEVERQQAIDERDAARAQVDKLEHQLSKNRLSPEEYQAMIAAPYKRAAGVPDPTMDDA